MYASTAYYTSGKHRICADVTENAFTKKAHPITADIRLRGRWGGGFFGWNFGQFYS